MREHPQTMKEKEIHELLPAFKEVLRKQFPFVLPGLPAGRRKQEVLRPVLLAVSGGMDSMVLAHLLHTAGISAIWVHCNFHLRGAESDRDADFVQKQAVRSGIPVIIREFETRAVAAGWKMSIEETARKLRYDFFEDLINASREAWGAVARPAAGPQFLMTAHHANDQVETLLMNFFRGCGMSGLHGIPAKNRFVLRPLLGFKRAVLQAYAAAEGITWVEDSTNQSTDYTRNFLRNKILPDLKEVYPVIEDTLLDNIQRLSQSEILYQATLEKYKKRLMRRQNGYLQLSVLLLKKSGIAATLLWEVLKVYGFGYRQIPEIEKLLLSESGAYQDNPAKDYRILRNRENLVLTPLDSEAAALILIESQCRVVYFPKGQLDIRVQDAASFKVNPDPMVAQLDIRELRFPLLLRKWKPGDYFYPLGMRRKKKDCPLSD